MGMPFSRTLRALEHDRSSMGLVALVGALLICGAWSFWFFGARLSLYQTTGIVEVARRNEVIAYFPPGTPAPPRGQMAQIRLANGTASIPAVVIESSIERDGRVRAVLMPQAAFPVTLVAAEIGQVAIETARVSPAMIVLGEGS